jgi:hypothetical protein
MRLSRYRLEEVRTLAVDSMWKRGGIPRFGGVVATLNASGAGHEAAQRTIADTTSVRHLQTVSGQVERMCYEEHMITLLPRIFDKGR